MIKIGGQRIAGQTILLLVLDAGLIIGGLLVAAFVRDLQDTGWIGFDGYRTFLRFLVVVVICLFSLYYNELYDPQVLRQHTELFVHLLQAFGIACASLALVYYLFPLFSLGRGVAALAAPILLSLTLGVRLLLENSNGLVQRPSRVLIIGTGHAGIMLTREILSRPELNMKVIGFLDEKGENLGMSLVNPGIIGGVNEVSEIVSSHKVDRLVLSLAERRGTTPVDQLLRIKFAGVPIEDAHSAYETVSGRILLERLTPSWLILSEGFRKNPFLMATKRTLDVFVSLIGILLTFPIMGVVALAIWMESGKPILFRQKRVGLHGKEFEMMKFRSMRKDAEAAGPAWATTNDSRITKLGAFLRKYRLDELPQLINVLRGDMSLVGPRPEQPHFCELLRQNLRYFDQRHSVRPGITGWAQVKYQYGATVEESKIKLELDLFYIKHLSTFLDLAIIFETVKVMLIGRGAQ
jgi:sugar transferase (PEP-CTERM system associated)